MLGKHQNDSLECLVVETKLREVCAQFAAEPIEPVGGHAER